MNVRSFLEKTDARTEILIYGETCQKSCALNDGVSCQWCKECSSELDENGLPTKYCDKCEVIETVNVFEGKAEETPYKYTGLEIYNISAFIRGQGKNGRKTHQTKPVIKLYVALTYDVYEYRRLK